MVVPIESAQRLCPQCSGTVDADARFCKQCAFDLTMPQIPQDAGSQFEVEQPATRNYLPLAILGIAVVLLVGVIGLFAVFKLYGSSETANTNSTLSAPVPVLGAKAQKAEENIYAANR